MKYTIRITILATALLLSACANRNDSLYDEDAGVDAAPGFNEGSSAYFQSDIGDRVHFAVDQSTLSGEARSILAEQAHWMISHPEFSAIVEGHADERGTREYNLALGARRASAARDFLVNQGVADDRIQTVTYGKERPIALCSSESCYADNRRAVTVLNTDTLFGADTEFGIDAGS